MADTQKLFSDLTALSKDDAKTLGEMLKAKLPKKDKKADTASSSDAEAASEEAAADAGSEEAAE